MSNEDDSCPTAMLVRLNYEVFGKVQGVFFRKHTLKTAERLGVSGWVQNTPQGTVQGQAEGPQPAVEEFKKWLQHKGSPKCRIDRCEFSDETQTDKNAFDDFKIVKSKKR